MAIGAPSGAPEQAVERGTRVGNVALIGDQLIAHLPHGDVGVHDVESCHRARVESRAGLRGEVAGQRIGLVKVRLVAQGGEERVVGLQRLRGDRLPHRRRVELALMDARAADAAVEPELVEERHRDRRTEDPAVATAEAERSR